MAGGQQPVEGTGAPPPSVLIVEDHDQVRAALTEILEDLGARTIGATNKDEALAAVAGTHIDLVLTDAVLATSTSTTAADADANSGLALVRALHEARPDLDVIVLSAYHEAQLAFGDLADRYEFWSKPPDIERLARRLARLRRG